MVIDEFAGSTAELPEFMTALLDIAQRGRSLGVHLLLATQRPAGVVSEGIKANTNIRIALRVHDQADSTDVLGLSGRSLSRQADAGPCLSPIGPGRPGRLPDGHGHRACTRDRALPAAETVQPHRAPAGTTSAKPGEPKGPEWVGERDQQCSRWLPRSPQTLATATARSDRPS